MQDLRWSAGAVLGGVDWVFEHLFGYSVLEEVVFKPFAGDPREIGLAAGAWTNCGALLTAVGQNHARLVPTTVVGWQGAAADAFRAAMGLLSEGFVRLGRVDDEVASALRAVALMVRAVALGLGKVLKEIAQLLLEVAVEAAAPGLGWAKLALTAYDRVEKIVQMVRIASALIEAAFDAVATFAEAQAMALGEVGRFEDLTEGVVRRAGQAARS